MQYESDMHGVASKNTQIIAFFRCFFTAMQRVMVALKIADWDKILRQKLHISYICQFMLPQIFKYLIEAKDVEVRKHGESVLENIQSTVWVNRVNIESLNKSHCSGLTADPGHILGSNLSTFFAPIK